MDPGLDQFGEEMALSEKPPQGISTCAPSGWVCVKENQAHSSWRRMWRRERRQRNLKARKCSVCCVCAFKFPFKFQYLSTDSRCLLSTAASTDGTGGEAEQRIDEEKRSTCVFVCQVHLLPSSLLVQLMGSILILILSFNSLSALTKTNQLQLLVTPGEIFYI